MRQRRVLALLLALSLVVSGNGMTVLAAEQGADMPVSMSQEETQDIEDNSEEKEEASDSTEETSGTEDKSEETKTPEEGDTSDGEDGTEQGDTTENPENPDNAGETDPSAPKEDDTEQGGDQPPAEDGEQNGDQPTTEDGEDGGQEEEPGTEEQDPAADVQEPSVSENDVAETEEPEELEEKTGEVRMMSFTDASGLQITFDANAAEKNADNVIIDENGVLTGIKEGATVEGVVDLRKVEFTEIGEGAFAGIKVTYVMLPKTVTSIGKNGFSGCAGLKGISIPSKLSTIGEGAFETCTNLTQLAIPNSVTSIGANAFKGDYRLFMVNMPSADYSRLETIGDSAFEGCSVLEFFCSDDDYDLPDSVKTIGVSAFKNCVSIKEVDMADGITSLGASAYQGCEGLQKVEIAGGFTAVPERAFADCHNLIKLEFGALAYCVTIESFAFENCISLASVDITEDVSTIKVNAFKGCEKLLRIYITSKRTILENMAFPNNKNMCMIASEKNLEARRYAKENGVERLIFYDEIGRGDYYSYTADVTCPAGKVEITVTKEISASATDINKVVNKDGVPPYNVGVKAGTECFVMINLGNYKDTLRLVPGSLRCNGEEIDYDKNRRVYHFNMPNGGAAITAEFEFIDKENIVEGNKDTIEGRLSSDVDYDFERNIAYMQEGKSAKFYLISTYKGKVTRIPTSKINYRIAQGSKKGIVSVDAKGEVKALKEGTSIVEAVVMTNSGEVIKDLTVVVKASTGIDHIRVQLDENKYKTLTVDRDENGLIDGVSLATMSVNSNEFKFEIEADAFSVEDDDKMKVAFTWVSSDTKVAKLKKSSTAAGSSDNEITIPRGADGEATITVSAKGKDNRKVTKKFVVSVQNYAPRLTESKIVVNPKQTDGAATLGIIDAYGYDVDRTKVIEAYENKTNGIKVSGFTFEYVKKEGVVSTYKVKAQGIKQGTYSVKLKVYVKVGTASNEYETPLTIEIKESQPAPTVSFDKKAEKINLFLAKDGVEIKPVIGKLGDDVVSEFSLEPLTESDHKNYEDDKKFTENFRIDPKTGTITQKADNLLKNKAGKPVLTGYLVLKFEGYGDLKKKYKITIPTKTTAPAYVLDRTTDTFGVGFSEEQTVCLQLLDKKTKKPIEWDEGFTGGVTIDTDATTFLFVKAKMVPITDENNKKYVNIEVKIPANSANKTGKLVMRVRNSKWAEGKAFKYTYNIKIDSKPHKLSLKKSTITLNANYPERPESFELISNHRDQVITGQQSFEPQPTKKNADGFRKLSVTCEDGKGSVSLQSGGQDIAAGNYKYIYTYQDTAGKENKVALTVKVSKGMPTVSLKGTNSLNLQAKDGERYVEVSEMTMTVKNLPAAQKYLPGTEPSDKPDEGNTGGDNQGGDNTARETPGG
ncbi:MAG: leucine-rich repeat protein [Lachnospiraceae bacterium]